MMGRWMAQDDPPGLHGLPLRAHRQRATRPTSMVLRTSSRALTKHHERKESTAMRRRTILTAASIWLVAAATIGLMAPAASGASGTGSSLPSDFRAQSLSWTSTQD